MQILDEILASLPEGKVLDVWIGLHWTAVIVDVDGKPRCGLSATLREEHGHTREPDVPDAGELTRFSGRELAAPIQSKKATLASVGGAAINALLPQYPQAWIDCNASDLIVQSGKNKRVALVGHFSFVTELLSQVAHLDVLEQNPQPGDLPAHAADEILPNADVVAITGMTLTNHTLDHLLGLCSPKAEVMILGPSTPLSPVLFEHGVHLLSGAVVENIQPVIKAVTQGANFHQVRQSGARLVNMARDKYLELHNPK
jgi:uncharacterized protein (DUF4213/DUF364 family)